MRRLTRLQSPRPLFGAADAAVRKPTTTSNSAARQRPALTRATGTLLRQRAGYTTTTTAPSPRTSSPCTRYAVRRPSQWLGRAGLMSTSAPRLRETTPAEDAQNQPEEPAGDGALEALQPEESEAAELAYDAQPEDGLVVPGELETAPRPGQINDASYVPAESGAGLEEVGGLDGWWDDEANWDTSIEYRGFVPQRHATDPAVLEVLARCAVMEALALRQRLQQGGGEEGVTLASASVTTWSCNGGLSALRAALALQPSVQGADVTVAGDVAAVVESLMGGYGADTIAESLPFDVDVEEARELVASWQKDGSNWKEIALDDVALKFAINKRILQLTGHMLPDAQLANANTVGGLLAVLVQPPKPKKLAEELAADGELAGLPNVAVYGRRVTPIDKHKTAGRWKVIAQELEKRGLPVTGTGGYSKSVERKWAFQ